MEKPKIKLISKIKNKTHGGFFPSFWAVRFSGDSIWYAPKKHVFPCLFCKKRKLNYLLFQEGRTKNYLFCPSCIIANELKDLETEKIGIKMIETV